MKIAVIGSGTAGILSLAHCLAFFPKDWQVTSIYDPNIPMLGIGESTSTQIPQTLFYATGLNLLDMPNELDMTVKHGVKYVNWREDNFFTKIPPPYYAMHFNNFSLKEFAFKQFEKKWNTRFLTIEGEIITMHNQVDSVTVTLSNHESHDFDYVIDCRGFPKDSNDHIAVDSIPVNHCLVHTIKEAGTWSYTFHQAHANGWMFGIPLQTRQGWGYLYNDTITSKEEAIDDIADIFKTRKEDLNLREFSFNNYKAKKFIDGRIIKNGNMALFYEPIEALSSWFYDNVLRLFFEVVITKQVTEDQANSFLHGLAVDYELFICYMYHGGSKFNSPFWNKTAKKCKDVLDNSDRFKKHITIMNQADHALDTNTSLVFPIGVWRDLNHNMKYQYF